VDARRKLRLLAEAMGALSSVFFFDYSGVAVAWRLLSMVHQSYAWQESLNGGVGSDERRG
jgi:hypothetical protein